MIAERSVGVAPVQVQQRRFGGLPDRLIEVAEGLAVQSELRADHASRLSASMCPGATCSAWLQSSMAWASRFSMKWMLARQR